MSKITYINYKIYCAFRLQIMYEDELMERENHPDKDIIFSEEYIKIRDKNYKTAFDAIRTEGYPDKPYTVEVIDDEESDEVSV